MTSPRALPPPPVAGEDLVGVEVRVPGSTSNLGPGFDALGLALQSYLRVRVEAVGRAATGALEWRFDGTPPHGDNLIEHAYRRLAGDASRAWPSLSLHVSSDIPMRAGLGSSAAAIVAGLRLAARITGSVPLQRLLDLAAGIEGHPDNTSASLLGGFVASCRGSDGRVAAVAVPWPPGLRLVVATPALALATTAARAVLPAVVPMADAVANVQRAALLVQAIAGGDRRCLREAFRDALHQPYREPLVPGLREALAFEHPDLHGVFLSGAGPSIAAVVGDDGRAVAGLFDALYRRLELPCSVRVLDVHQPATRQR